MSNITLEVEVDLPLSDEDVAKYALYREHGMDERTALRQVAQDVLGSTGAIVQGAEAVPT